MLLLTFSAILLRRNDDEHDRRCKYEHSYWIGEDKKFW